jgi:hypothetical protein
MFKLEKIELKNRLISGFPPSEIQLGLEGYLLREDLKVQWQISRFTNVNWVFGVSITFIAIFILIIGFPILLSFSGVVWPIFVILFLFLIVFWIVYWLVKLSLDKSARYEMGAKQGFLPAELIFSHYPLKVGENDRITFRRRLKQNFWTNLFKVHDFPANSRLKVSLICLERATYTKGTDTVTDVATAYESVIFSKTLIPGDREVKSHFDLEIPSYLSPSFEGKNNQIRWILQIEESYPGLIDLKMTYLTFVVDS